MYDDLGKGASESFDDFPAEPACAVAPLADHLLGHGAGFVADRKKDQRAKRNGKCREAPHLKLPLHPQVGSCSDCDG